MSKNQKNFHDLIRKVSGKYQIAKPDKRGDLSVTGMSYLYNETTKNIVTPAVVKFMDDQLFIDASGSWVRRTANR